MQATDLASSLEAAAAELQRYEDALRLIANDFGDTAGVRQRRCAREALRQDED